jgi:type IV pilus assembly protein PilC
MPLALVMAYKLVGKSEVGRWALDVGILRVPVLGRIMRKSAISRFSRTLGTLLSAGVPILDALNIARQTVGNVVFERALQKVHDAVREGESFAPPLRATGTCDLLVTNMIDVGEETGELDRMLLKISDTYDEQIDVLVGSLVSLLEPVMVILLGIIVGTIVLALILPMVKLMGDLGAAGGG